MSRRPVKGLEQRAPAEPAPRPPGPTEILGPDGRRWIRDPDGLYYDEHRTEVFSQSALRDLIERSAERLLRAMSRRQANPLLRPIASARSVAELERLYRVYREDWSNELTTAARSRRAVLELPPREDR